MSHAGIHTAMNTARKFHDNSGRFSNGPMMIRILFLGDIVGEPGRTAVTESVRKFKTERGVDFVIVNGENSAGGRGITPKISIDLLRAGVAVITSGDHIWDQKEVITYLD